MLSRRTAGYEGVMHDRARTTRPRRPGADELPLRAPTSSQSARAQDVVLDLQAGAGNAAISRWLDRRSAPPPLGPMLQRFTAELDGGAVFLRLEKGDKDADLRKLGCRGA